MINGRVFDWEAIKIVAPFGVPLEIVNVSYSTESPAEAVYGRGRAPRGYGRGNLVQEAAIDLPAPSFIQLTAFAVAFGGIMNIKRFTISVAYANDDQLPQIDILPSCIITRVETDAAQGDMEVNVKRLSLNVLDPIKFNGVAVL